MLVAKNLITYQYYLKVRKLGVKTFLYNEIDFIPLEDQRDEIFYNCSSQRVESTWFTWATNDLLIQSFKKKFPQIFQLNGYDITLAIQKAMYWSNFKTGFLWYSINNFFPNEKIYYAEPMHHSSIISVWSRYIKEIKFPKIKPIQNISNPEDGQDFQNKYAIHVKSDFQFGFYINIVQTAKLDSDFRVFTEPDVSEIYLKELNLSKKNTIIHTNASYSFALINPLKLNKMDLFTLNIILMHWNEISRHIETAEFMIHKGLKSVLINEAENGVYGAVVSEVFKKHKVIVYNTMNGVKSGEAQDAFINFDYWFVWDNQMKEMFTNLNKLPASKLIVSGHLVEDLISNYQYHNSFELDLDILKTKKVISIFTVKGKRHVKIEAMKYFFDLLDRDESIFLVIRPHPSENPDDYILPIANQERVHFANYNSKNLSSSLHDLLLISDLAIVFGSTVALDAKWMDVPCITFELREKSMIYCVDNEKIKHAKTLNEFKDLVISSLHKKTSFIKKEPTSVSNFILNELKKN